MNGYQTYKQQAAAQLSAAQNVALLLDKASSHMNEAYQAIVAQDIEKRTNHCNQAYMIISGLKNALIRQQPAQKMTDLLDRYYSVFQKMIMQAAVQSDLNGIKSMQQNFKTMADYWRHVHLKVHVEPIDATSCLSAQPVTLGI